MENCPVCHTRMKHVFDTPAAMNRGNLDNTNMYDYLQCPKCLYYEGYTGERDEYRENGGDCS